MKDHTRTPLFDALKKHQEKGVIPFHVPGHKHGAGLPELVEFLGKKIFEVDLNAMEDIDDMYPKFGMVFFHHTILLK